ncbi:hypothetical protein MUG94_16905 [Arthrobacter gengyunqii]|uniref:DUF308 domain-containing protein n=1 Tax=Arthrobacter gengyunqii TaxID=2886940 RepID=A0A9X1S4Y4_9MICC|nr:hypothetical protein [Arthrobacter gengyunqii]MCC3268795.1 hypothetical protein [Arthrobacter gengyunqii]UOY96179.1 hypothetical protein MUG94_16905 [Arthrobacter gengyunqii]
MTRRYESGGSAVGDSNHGTPWVPILLRSATAAAFGILTVFWQSPGVGVLSVAGGLYLLLTAVSVWRMAVLAGTDGEQRIRSLQLLEAAAYALAGIAVLALRSVEGFLVAAGLALVVGGAVELYLWTTSRKTFLPARDWLITGVVSLGTAVILLAVQLMDLGAHAMLGVTGGSAIIIAVMLATSGLGARWDARSQGSQSRPSPAVRQKP